MLPAKASPVAESPKAMEEKSSLGGEYVTQWCYQSVEMGAVF